MMLQDCIKNQKGGVLMTTMIVISLVLVIFSSILSMKITELSRRAFQVNESFRYLNVMEEMGAIIGHARDLYDAGACPGGTTSFTSSGVGFCLPGTGLTTTCVTDYSRHDAASTTTYIKYCLKVTTGIDASHALAKNKDRSNVADITFDIVPVRERSLIEKVFFALVETIPQAQAACDLNQNWNNPCTPDNLYDVSDPAYATVTASPAVVPAVIASEPTGTSSTSTTSYASRANLERWTPSITTWTTAGTNNRNEIYTPTCNVASYDEQYWLGCMSCSDANVTCIDIQVCQSDSGTGVGGCTKPIKQRLALYKAPDAA